MAKKNKLTARFGKSKTKKASADSVAAFKLPGNGKTNLLKPAKQKTETQKFVEGVGRALRRAAKVARKVVKEHGTPIYVWEDGKVVVKKP